MATVYVYFCGAGSAVGLLLATSTVDGVWCALHLPLRGLVGAFFLLACCTYVSARRLPGFERCLRFVGQCGFSRAAIAAKGLSRPSGVYATFQELAFEWVFIAGESWFDSSWSTSCLSWTLSGLSGHRPFNSCYARRLEVS